MAPVCGGTLLRLRGGESDIHKGHHHKHHGIEAHRERRFDPIGSIKNGAKAAHDSVHGKAERVRKPLMNRINVIRTQMCYARPKLMEHQPCMKFLAKRCLKESTGEGICHGFTDQVDDACFGNSPYPKGSPEKMCRLATKLCEFLEKKCKHMEEEEEDEEEAHLEDKVVEKMAPAPAPVAAAPAAAPAAADPNADDDGDGVPNGKDAFPNDPEESKDMDGDGIGDNSDPDKDGDGVNNTQDAFPGNKNETGDMDGDGIGDNVDPDKDGDGHNNTVDKFPDDPKEWGDLDGDGIGDNSDPDKDGDGRDNADDAFPDDPKKKDKEEKQEVKEEGKAELKVTDDDRDGDGVPNSEDVFPDNPNESKDTDGDGHGDNEDEFPKNPNCFTKGEPCDQEEDMDGVEATMPLDPATLTMKLSREGLPEQGYHGKNVKHGPDTWVENWQHEWPATDESEEETVERICADNPENEWCRDLQAKNENGLFGMKIPDMPDITR